MTTIAPPKYLLLNPVKMYNDIGTGSASALFISTSSAGGLLSGGSAKGASVLTIYKGAIPDASTFQDRTTRDSDILISYELPPYNVATPALGPGYRLAYTPNVSTSIRLLVAVSQTTAEATQSGVATWFWLGSSPIYTDMRGSTFIIGTVGKTTDVADLEIPDNNIVAGSEYKSIGCYISLPFKFTI